MTRGQQLSKRRVAWMAPREKTTMLGFSALGGAGVDESFPPQAPINFPQGSSVGKARNKPVPEPVASLVQTGFNPSDLEGSKREVCGLQLWEMGEILCQSLRGFHRSAGSPRMGRIVQRYRQSTRTPFPFLPFANCRGPFYPRILHGLLIGCVLFAWH